MPILDVYRTVMTQWRVGMSGPYGLDYNVLPFALRACGIPMADWPDTFDGIRVAESVALEMWSKDK